MHLENFKTNQIKSNARTLVYFGEYNDSREFGLRVVGNSRVEDEDPWTASIQISLRVTTFS